MIVGFLIPLRSKDGEHSPSEELEHVLHPWVAFLILPLFAFANAGVSVQGISFDALMGTLPLGILLGLFVGKPLGIFTACLISVKLGFAKLPERITLNQIFAVSVLCGIGFTMSIFIAGLAFTGFRKHLTPTQAGNSDWFHYGGSYRVVPAPFRVTEENSPAVIRYSPASAAGEYNRISELIIKKIRYVPEKLCESPI